MAHQHKWWIENRVFYNEYDGSTSGDDLKAMAVANFEYLDSSDAPLVHCLVNITNMGSVPLNVKTVKDATLGTLGHPKMGWLIAYGKNDRFMSFVAGIVTQMFKSRYRMFDTYEEAIEFLQSVDSTLPNLQEIRSPAET